MTAHIQEKKPPDIGLRKPPNEFIRQDAIAMLE